MPSRSLARIQRVDYKESVCFGPVCAPDRPDQSTSLSEKRFSGTIDNSPFSKYFSATKAWLLNSWG